MPIGLADNELLIRCSCYSFAHQARLVHDPGTSRGNNLKGADDDWYLSVMLDEHRFWKQLLLAARYIFFPRSIVYGMYSEIVLRSEDVDKIAQWIWDRRRMAQS